jgi:hypothetical protein
MVKVNSQRGWFRLQRIYTLTNEERIKEKKIGRGKLKSIEN